MRQLHPTGSRRTIAVFVALVCLIVSLMTAIPAKASGSGGSEYSGFHPGTALNGAVYDMETFTVGGQQKLLLAGAFTNAGGSGNNYVVLLNADGSVDTSFNPGTKLNQYATSVLVDQSYSPARILVGGGFTSVTGTTNRYLARFSLTGVVDTGFTVGTAFDAAVRDVRLVTQSDVRYYAVGGMFDPYSMVSTRGLTMLTQTGAQRSMTSSSMDLPSGTHVYSLDATGSDASLSYLVGGKFTDVGTTGNDYLTKFNVPLAKTSFFQSDTTFTPGDTLNNYVNSAKTLTVDGQRKYLVGGAFTDAGPAGNDYVHLFNADGTTDSTFQPGGLLNGFVESVADVTIEGEQKFVVAGRFTDAGSPANDSVVLLNRDGSVYDYFSPPAATGIAYTTGPLTIGDKTRLFVGGAIVFTGANNRASVLNLPSPPEVALAAASAVTSTSAIVSATLQTSNGYASAGSGIRCLYSTDSLAVDSGTGVTATPGTFDGASQNLSVSCPLSGLAPSTTYYYRVTAASQVGIGRTATIGQFTTSAPSLPDPEPPVVNPTPPATPVPPAAPAQAAQALGSPAPKSVKNTGLTTLNKPGAKTTAGLPVTATVKAGPGSAKCLKTIKGKNRGLQVKLTGKCAVKLTVTYTAPGSSAHLPLKVTKTYKTKRSRR